MANPTCTTASLNLPCFDDTLLSPFLRKCFLIYFKSAELAKLGGTNYMTLFTNPAAGGLVEDTVAFADEKVSIDNIGKRYVGTWEVAIAFNNATAAGFSAGTGAALNATAMTQIKCLMNCNEALLDRMNLFLECQLGVHKAYPQ